MIYSQSDGLHVDGDHCCAVCIDSIYIYKVCFILYSCYYSIFPVRGIALLRRACFDRKINSYIYMMAGHQETNTHQPHKKSNERFRTCRWQSIAYTMCTPQTKNKKKQRSRRCVRVVRFSATYFACTLEKDAFIRIGAPTTVRNGEK